MKSIAEATGKTLQGVKTLYEESGDLGTVAQNSRSTQKTMFPSPPLTIDGVYKAFKFIATATGKDVPALAIFFFCKLLLAHSLT